jgi:hypothetical protein
MIAHRTPATLSTPSSSVVVAVGTEIPTGHHQRLAVTLRTVRRSQGTRSGGGCTRSSGAAEASAGGRRTRTRNPEHPAGDLDRMSLARNVAIVANRPYWGNRHLQQLACPLGGASSASGSAIRRLAACSSASSSLRRRVARRWSRARISRTAGQQPSLEFSRFHWPTPRPAVPPPFVNADPRPVPPAATIPSLASAAIRRAGRGLTGRSATSTRTCAELSLWSEASTRTAGHRPVPWGSLTRR